MKLNSPNQHLVPVIIVDYCNTLLDERTIYPARIQYQQRLEAIRAFIDEVLQKSTKKKK